MKVNLPPVSFRASAYSLICIPSPGLGDRANWCEFLGGSIRSSGYRKVFQSINGLDDSTIGIIVSFCRSGMRACTSEAVPSTFEDEMFYFRRATPSDIPGIKNLVLASFTSGELGQNLTFGDLEFEEYLDWFLPRAVADQKVLFYVLEFRPRSSFRHYPARIIGCIYVKLSEPLKSTYSFPGLYDAQRISFTQELTLDEGISLLQLRMLNAIEDIKVWPNMHAAEVHKRLAEVHKKLAISVQNTTSRISGQVCFFMIQEKFRGTGLGSRMLSWTCKLAREKGLGQLDFVLNANTRAISQKWGFPLQCLA